MRVFVLGNAQRPGVPEEAERLLPFLREHSEIAVYDLVQEKDLSQESADLALVLGGDGAILRAARQMGYRQTPVLGVNLGRLGFLADLQPDDLRTCFPQVARGQYRVTQHLMFECVVDGQGAERKCLGLNEVVVHSAPPLHMLELVLQVDGEAVAKFSADGLIVSTPIGSTGHSLSAGGPILEQELSAFVITPICPHALTFRPVVDAADKTYTITLGSGEEGLLIVDGQETVPFRPEQRVIVRRAPVAFRLVKVPGRGIYQTLREKLRWGMPPQYRGEP